jgi:hypothetical protein
MSGHEYDPGWYRQREQPDVERYHDGSKWTDAYRAIPATAQRGGFAIWKVVLAIILAVMIINAILAAGGHQYLGGPDRSNDSSSAPSYQLVPCAEHPEAYGC